MTGNAAVIAEARQFYDVHPRLITRLGGNIVAYSRTRVHRDRDAWEMLPADGVLMQIRPPPGVGYSLAFTPAELANGVWRSPGYPLLGSGAVLPLPKTSDHDGGIPRSDLILAICTTVTKRVGVFVGRGGARCRPRTVVCWECARWGPVRRKHPATGGLRYRTRSRPSDDRSTGLTTDESRRDNTTVPRCRPGCAQ